MKKSKRFISMLLALTLMMSLLPANVFAADIRQTETDNYTFNIIEETKTYTEMEITNKNTGEIEFLKSYTQDNGERLFVAEKNNEVTYIKSEKDGYVILDESYNVIDRQKITGNVISFDTSATLAADWSSKTYFEGDEKTDFTNMSIVVAVICLIAGAPAASGKILLIADFIVNNFIDNVYYKGWYRDKWEDGLYYTQRYTSFYENSNYTGFIEFTDIVNFH